MAIPSYVKYLLEDAFSELSYVEAKPMFGGYGFYLDGQIFGFTIDGDQLVLKANKETRAKFEKKGGEQFIYHGHKNKGPVAMPYWTVPQDILEDPKELAVWAKDSASLSKPKN